MNVLVYSGSEVNQKSLDGTLDLLRSVCLPNYTVQPLTKASFAKDPWEVSCALLVLPDLKDGGPSADVDIFTPKEVGRLREYIEQSGGAFLGLGLGARFDDAQGGLEASFSGLNLGYGGQSYIKPEDQRAPLKFVDKASKISVFPITGTSARAETVASTADQAEVEAKTVDPTLPSAEGFNKSFKVVAASPSGATIAGYLPAGKGLVALARIVTESDDPSLRPLFRSLLSNLNLHLPPPSDPSSSTDLAPLPQFLTSIPPPMDGTSPPKFIVTSILRGFFPHAQTSTHLSGNVKDIEDTFNFLSLNAEWARDLLQGKKPPVPVEENEKHILVCLDGALPPKDDTPHFDLQVYYDTLRKLRGGYASEDPQGWGIGEALIYGERVTSTQTMFDKNPTILSRMPTPVLSIAAQQLAGRGRGKNVWLSPEGCLQMSLLVRVNLDHGTSSQSSSTPSGGKTTGKTAKTSETDSAKTAKTSSTDSAKTTKTEVGRGPKGTKTTSSESPAATKTTKTEVSGGPKSTKTTSSTSHGATKTSESSTSPKTTKTTSTGIKTTKTTTSGETSGLKSSKTTTSDGSLKTAATGADTKSTKATTSQLKTNPIGPETKAKTTKTTASSHPEPSTKTASAFTQPLLERFSSAFALALPPPEEPHINPLPPLSASKLVFIQYLFALAVCEASRLPEVLGPELGKRVRIKWPNDLYLDLSVDGKRELKKIGGILVNTNFAPGGKVDIVIGCGLNVLNEPPISSLSQLTSLIHTGAPTQALSMERTAAAIMVTFSKLWDQFTSGGGSFEPFLSSYYSVWLHTDQRVTVTTTTPPVKAKIVGITPDYGLLRTVKEDDGDDGGWGGDRSYGRYVYGAKEGGKEYIDLQPDGNSFDLMANLIKAKTT